MHPADLECGKKHGLTGGADVISLCYEHLPPTAKKAKDATDKPLVSVLDHMKTASTQDADRDRKRQKQPIHA